jgi:hypothetical protein
MTDNTDSQKITFLPIVLTTYTCLNVWYTEPVRHLFALTAFLVVVFLAALYICKEIKRVYPQKKQKKKIIIAILSALSILIIAPLTAILNAFLLFDLFKTQTKNTKPSAKEILDSPVYANYIFIGLSVLVGTCVTIASILKEIV